MDSLGAALAVVNVIKDGEDSAHFSLYRRRKY
jgi:hypothetical protein